MILDQNLRAWLEVLGLGARAVSTFRIELICLISIFLTVSVTLYRAKLAPIDATITVLYLVVCRIGPAMSSDLNLTSIWTELCRNRHLQSILLHADILFLFTDLQFQIFIDCLTVLPLNFLKFLLELRINSYQYLIFRLFLHQLTRTRPKLWLNDFHLWLGLL